MGKNSIDVYFWHFKLFLILEYLFNLKRIFYISYMGKIMFLILAVVISVFLSQGGIISYPIKQIKKYCFS